MNILWYILTISQSHSRCWLFSGLDATYPVDLLEGYVRVEWRCDVMLFFSMLLDQIIPFNEQPAAGQLGVGKSASLPYFL